MTRAGLKRDLARQLNTLGQVRSGGKRAESRATPDGWRVVRLRDLVSYERPERYVVRGTEYSERGEIPVLTANKSFVLGYTAEEFGICRELPVIIFDDFTTDCKYVDFPFKVKSSAIKLLRPKGEGVNLRFVFGWMELNQFPVGGHKRHYISRYQNLELAVPDYDEQCVIAGVLCEVERLIAALERLIAKKRGIKQAAMQQLLTGKTRLPGFCGEWHTRRLGDVSRIGTGNRNNQDKVDDGEYPFFVRSATVERINSYSFEGEAILVPGEGGIGSIFHYIDGRFDVHQRVYRISQFSEDVCGKFLYHSMVLHFGRHAMQNTVKATVDSLRLPTFKGFCFPAPRDVTEQRAIAAVLSDMDEEIAALERRREKVKAIKQGMMQELLTGRIRLVEPGAHK